MINYVIIIEQSYKPNSFDSMRKTPMTTQVNVGRQTVLSADRDFTYDDFVSGTAKVMIYLKPSTRILRGWVDITTAFNPSGNCTYTVGDTEGATPDVDRWLTSTNAKATGLTALLAPLTDSVIDTAEALTMTVTVASGTVTAGAGKLHIEYIEEGTRTTEFFTRRS